MYAIYRTMICLFMLAHLLECQSINQWRCSSLDESNNRYYLPNFGGRNTVFENGHSLSDPNINYIYTVNENDINCSGTVTAIEFCYQKNIASSTSVVLDFSTLAQTSDTVFTTIKSIRVRRNSSTETCQSEVIFQRCCDVMSLLAENQFSLPDSNFKFFGVSGNANVVTNLCTFDATNQMYSTQVYYLIRGFPASGPMPFPLHQLWFHITPDLATTAPNPATTSAIPSTSSANVSKISSSTSIPNFTLNSDLATEVGITEAVQTNSIHSATTHVQTTQSPISTTTTTTVIRESTDTNKTEEPTDTNIIEEPTDTNKIYILVIAIVAASFGLVCIVVIILIFLLIMRCMKKNDVNDRHSPNNHIEMTSPGLLVQCSDLMIPTTSNEAYGATLGKPTANEGSIQMNRNVSYKSSYPVLTHPNLAYKGHDYDYPYDN